MRTAGNLALLLSLGLWGGTIVFYSFVVTPTLFSALGREDGGRAVNALFPSYFLAIFGFSAATALLAGFQTWQTPDAGWPGWAVAGAGLAAALVAAYSGWVLLPQVHAAERGTPAFDQLHFFSLGLNFVALALFVVSALLIARFPQALLGPARHDLGAAAQPSAISPTPNTMS